MGSNTYEKDFVTVGPWGGLGGRHWDDGVQDSVRVIVITYSSRGIDSIMFQYDKQGNIYWSKKHGGKGGYHTKKVTLDYPDEYLLAIRGFYGPIVGGPVCVRSLTFVSNVRAYGPFGVEQGHSFTFQMVEGQILGFYGRDGCYLDSIGAYIKHIICPHSPQSLTCPKKAGCCSVIEGNIADKYDVLAIKLPENPSTDNSSINAQVLNQILASYKQKSGASGGIVSYGPWGGKGGTEFDDENSFNDINQIVLSIYNETVVGLRVAYEENGKSLWGSYHGSRCGCTDKISLDYPSEILTNISGYYAPTANDGSTVIIRSLTFHTSKGKYGPYGKEVGVPFCSNLNEGIIVGIHGRTTGAFLHAIGVHFKEGKHGSSSVPDASGPALGTDEEPWDMLEEDLENGKLV